MKHLPESIIFVIFGKTTYLEIMFKTNNENDGERNVYCSYKCKYTAMKATKKPMLVYILHSPWTSFQFLEP